MQTLIEINNLIQNLNSLKPELSKNLALNQEKFNDVLQASMKSPSESFSSSKDIPLPNKKNDNDIPEWVASGYRYDPNNPRKPNMRELMEAISGKDLESLYNTTEGNWQKISREASLILYGVVGSNADTRNWDHIMGSENILESAQEQTRAMHQPTVDIVSNFDENNNLKEQLAVIKDKDGSTLRFLSNNLPLAEEALRNFGANRDSIPNDLADRVNPNIFDKNLLTFLKNFDAKPPTVDKIIIRSAGEDIANKLSQETPIEELEKL